MSQLSKDLSTEPRCKSWTNAPGQIILGFSKVKQDDEGEYRVEIENEHGMQEHTFSLYVTVAGGMDFRAMLMRKKKPAKKVVVVSSHLNIQKLHKYKIKIYLFYVKLNIF